ncbi:MAG: TIGR01777 family oxidoreductase [Crocinitomicaceae bacterium]|nr:TIGR01777 family oxidoreductase [Crocinitomicaceae bacterium]
MKIVIAGGSGFLGEVLNNYFRKQGHEVMIISRSKPKFDCTFSKWNGKTKGEWIQEIEGCDVLINLAGKSVDCRYTKGNKNLIMSSRVDSTAILHKALSSLKNKPKIWLNAASATIYRHSLDKSMSEENGEIGTGFSVDVCKAWENAFFKESHKNVRQVALRTSIVIGNTGGALKPIKNLVNIFFGGKQGKGDQMFSWIHELDFARAVEYIIKAEDIAGVINIASTMPITNETFMKTMRKYLKRPFGFPMPPWLLEVGAFFIGTETELILKSRYINPKTLSEKNFKWIYSDINQALKDLIKEKNQKTLII